MAEVRYRRNIAGENYVTRSRFGPVGQDIERRTRLVYLTAYRSAPVGEIRVGDDFGRESRIPGALRRSHSYEVTAGTQLRGTVTADARRRGQATSYAMSVHEGSEAHWIRPRRPPLVVDGKLRARYLRWPRDGHGEDVFRREVYHPGTTRARPWLRDSLEAARG